MGLTAAMSFTGPTAPASRNQALNQRIPQDLFRLLLALLAGVTLAGLGLAGLLVGTAPRWLGLLVQPCSLLLLPGYLLECIDSNAYAFSGHSVLCTSAAFYFCLALLVLFPRSRNPRVLSSSQSALRP